MSFSYKSKTSSNSMINPDKIGITFVKFFSIILTFLIVVIVLLVML